jgi:hypothetical protein
LSSRAFCSFVFLAIFQKHPFKVIVLLIVCKLRLLVAELSCFRC